MNISDCFSVVTVYMIDDVYDKIPLRHQKVSEGMLCPFILECVND